MVGLFTIDMFGNILELDRGIVKVTRVRMRREFELLYDKRGHKRSKGMPTQEIRAPHLTLAAYYIYLIKTSYKK